MTRGKITGIRFEDGMFLFLVLVVTVAFGLVLKPFFGAILWALILAMLFDPLNRKLLAKYPHQPNTVAVAVLATILLIVVIPAILLGMALIQEFMTVYGQIRSGEIDFARLFQQTMQALPAWLRNSMASAGLTDFSNVRDQIVDGLQGSMQTLASRAFSFGQGTFNFLLMLGIMLYLAFFFIRDGQRLSKRIVNAIPLEPSQREAVVDKFAVVIRATIKGSLVVAIVQGAIGGLVFWLLGIGGALLWGVVMGAFSLIPAIGTAIVWVPVALYLFATGAYFKGAILVFCGIFVIGLVDNILRPILVGRDTRMPDYVVLVSTLGGLQVFGVSGFVIGPFVAALFIGTWNIFTETWRQPSGEVPPQPPAAEPPAARAPTARKPVARRKAAASKKAT